MELRIRADARFTTLHRIKARIAALVAQIKYLLVKFGKNRQLVEEYVRIPYLRILRYNQNCEAFYVFFRNSFKYNMNISGAYGFPCLVSHEFEKKSSNILHDRKA